MVKISLVGILNIGKSESSDEFIRLTVHCFYLLISKSYPVEIHEHSVKIVIYSNN